VKWNLHSRKGNLFAIIGLLAFGLSLAGLHHFRSARILDRKKVGNNPDKFYLWTTTNASVEHAFTYDPHAADDWRFESGGGSISTSNALWRGNATNSTNGQLPSER